MPYRFKHTETIEMGVRRIASEQIAKAQRMLDTRQSAVGAPPSDTDAHGRVVAVHGARKAIKRIRALLRIVRPALSEDDFVRENARFRDIAQALSATRDRHVMLQTLALLDDCYDHNAGVVIATIYSQVAAELLAGSPASTATSADYSDILSRLEAGRTAISALRLTCDGFDPVGEGLERCYRKGRKRFGSILAEPNNEAMHEWRKSVQLHWRHMALLRSAWPEVCGDRIAAAKELSRGLGLYNDLSVLDDYIATLPKKLLSKRNAKPVVELLKAEQRHQLKATEPIGRRLFADRPKALKQNFTAFWLAAASEPAEKTSG